MNLLKSNPRKVLTALALFSAFGSDLAADEPPAEKGSTVLQEIGRLLGGALSGNREAMFENHMAADFAVRADVPDPAPAAIAAKEADELKNRLQAYGDAMQEWINATCQLNEEQRASLRTLVVEQQAQPKLLKPDNPQQQQNQSFGAAFPLLFTGKNGIAARFRSGLLTAVRKEILTDDQKSVLEAALQERDAWRGKAFLNYVVFQLDRELFLTTEQRAALIEQLSTGKKVIDDPLYSFQPQAYYLPYKPLSQVLSNAGGKTVLDPAQRKRLNDLNGNDPNSQHIMFQAASGVEGWYKQMNEHSLQERGKFLRAAAVRVAWYTKELQLKDEQVEFLNNACKGAAIQAVGDWKQATQQTLEQMEAHMAQAGGNFGFGASNIDTNSLEKNEIWLDAVKTVTEGHANKDVPGREDVEMTATAESVAALLDDELWLLPQQRATLVELVRKSLPGNTDSIQSQQYIREIILIAHPIFRIPEDAGKTLFSESQNAIWKQLSSYFQWQKDNNYVQIPLRNGGGSFGFMLGQ